MAVKKIDTDVMTNAVKTFRDNIEEFDENINSIDKVTWNLLLNWVGDARTEFEVQYKLIFSQLKDVKGMLDDFYDMLVEAETGYYDVDQELGDQLKAQNS
jgi:WXG100 family type VII secretion target